MAAVPQSLKPRQRLAVLGSTGSVGVSTLDVVARHPARFEVIALTAHNKVDKLIAQADSSHARYIGITGAPDSVSRAQAMASSVAASLVTDMSAVCDLIRSDAIDTVVAGIVGAAGLAPVLAAVESGKRVLIANKEPMVMLGDMIMREARRSHATILPLDSEHNAIFQCLPMSAGTAQAESSAATSHLSGVKKLTLTASGGPFRTTALSELATVTPDMACAHPNWEMGRKISVDSATMMNKGLEIIEACHLFGVDESRVDVVVHPQSIIHSWVEYVDGSVIAHLANPDMRVPIAHALAWPNRFESGVDGPSMIDIARLDFESPDIARFPCLALARDSFRRGGTAPTTLNAANEIAVERFLNDQIGFTDIASLCERVLGSADYDDTIDLATALAADGQGRELARQWRRG